MPYTYVKEMLERDIQEKDQIKRAIKKLTILQYIVSIIGVLLLAAFVYNTYATHLAVDEVLKNRQETQVNRRYGITIINKLDTIILKKLK